jgi:hypothetical protein
MKSSITNKQTVIYKRLSISLLIVSVVLGGYYLSQNTFGSLEQKYLIFEGKSINIGDKFDFSADESACLKNTTATLSAINQDSIIFKMKEINWKDDLKKSIEEIVDYKVRNNECISARGNCMDVSYQYCFSFTKESSVRQVTYNVKGRSSMPQPPLFNIPNLFEWIFGK